MNTEQEVYSPGGLYLGSLYREFGVWRVRSPDAPRKVFITHTEAVDWLLGV